MSSPPSSIPELTTEPLPTRGKIRLQPFQPTAKRRRTGPQSSSNPNETEATCHSSLPSTTLLRQPSVHLQITPAQSATPISPQCDVGSSLITPRISFARPFARLAVRRALSRRTVCHPPPSAQGVLAAKASSVPQQALQNDSSYSDQHHDFDPEVQIVSEKLVSTKRTQNPASTANTVNQTPLPSREALFRSAGRRIGFRLSQVQVRESSSAFKLASQPTLDDLESREDEHADNPNADIDRALGSKSTPLPQRSTLQSVSSERKSSGDDIDVPTQMKEPGAHFVKQVPRKRSRLPTNAALSPLPSQIGASSCQTPHAKPRSDCEIRSKGKDLCHSTSLDASTGIPDDLPTFKQPVALHCTRNTQSASGQGRSSIPSLSGGVQKRNEHTLHIPSRHPAAPSPPQLAAPPSAVPKNTTPSVNGRFTGEASPHSPSTSKSKPAPRTVFPSPNRSASRSIRRFPPSVTQTRRSPERSPSPKRFRSIERLPGAETPCSPSVRRPLLIPSPRNIGSDAQLTLRMNPSPHRRRSISPLGKSPTRNALTPQRQRHRSRSPPRYERNSRLTSSNNYRSSTPPRNTHQFRSPPPLRVRRSCTPSRNRFRSFTPSRHIYRSRTPSPRRPRSRTPPHYYRRRRSPSPPSPRTGNRSRTPLRGSYRYYKLSRYGRRSLSPSRSVPRSRTPSRYRRRSRSPVRRISLSRSPSRHGRDHRRRRRSSRSMSPSRRDRRSHRSPRGAPRSRSRSRNGRRSRRSSRKTRRSRSRSRHSYHSCSPPRRRPRSHSRPRRDRHSQSPPRRRPRSRSLSRDIYRSRSLPRRRSRSCSRSPHRRRFRASPPRNSCYRNDATRRASGLPSSKDSAIAIDGLSRQHRNLGTKVSTQSAVIPFDPFSMGSGPNSRLQPKVTEPCSQTKEVPTSDMRAPDDFTDNPQTTQFVLNYRLHVVERR